MRISRRIQLAGLAALAGAGAAQDASADPLTVTTARTDPVFTATAAGTPPSPGNVTVESGGSITVDGVGEAAITVNSNNDVSISGTLASTNVDNTGGINILDGFSGTITIGNTGRMNILDNYTLDDTDDDGDFDGEFATGTGRYGVRLASGTYTGNITSSGFINVEGNNSYGIQINGLLAGNGTTTGNLTASGGTIGVTGDNSIAIAIQGGAAGGVAGDVFIRSQVVASGEGSQGLVVDAPITGQLRLNGAWRASGFHHITRPLDTDDIDADDLMIGGSAAAIHFSVGEGLTIEGIGRSDDADDDGDGIDDQGDDADVDDDNSAAINSYGSAPAIWIAADPSANLVLGPTSSGYGVNNLGLVAASGVYDDISATAIRIEGQGASTVTTAAGVRNEGQISSTAFKADAYGLYIGAGATVPRIQNEATISAAIGEAEAGDQATAIFIAAGANVSMLLNDRQITASVVSNDGEVITIDDESGNLLLIDNIGQISATIGVLDADEPITATATAIDLSNANGAVVINQNDNSNEAIEEFIAGDIRLGAFGDTINLNVGAIEGDITFGDGADVFNIDNGAIYRGALIDSGDLDVNIIEGDVQLTGNALISDMTVGAESQLTVALSGDELDPPVVQASGVVTFAPGAVVRPEVPEGLVEAEQLFLTAASMVGGSNVTGVVDGEGTPFIYNFEISLQNPLAADGAANGLIASYELKTAAELGLTTNQSAAYDPILAALRLDEDAAAAIISIDDADEFYDSFDDLLPSYASAAAEIATTAIQQSQSATSNRMATTRLQGLNEVSAWAQEIGYGLTREPPTANGQAFDGHGFGIAFGIDGPLDNGALFGLSASFIASEVEEENRPDGEISASIGQVNAYFGTALGPLDVDLIGGLGAGKMQSRRFVQIGESFNALSEADWWAFEGHGALRVSAPMSLGDWLVLTPQAAVTYVVLNEQDYEEEGGGAAVDYIVDSNTSQRAWGDAGLEISGRFRTGARGILAPRIFAGYRANIIDEEAERTFQFVSGGDPFTLTDEGYGDGGPLVGAGVDFTNGYSTIALGYEGEFGDQIERHSLNVSVRFRF